MYYSKIEYRIFFLLFRVMELHRNCEVTATPLCGRCQPERINRTIRGFILYHMWVRLCGPFPMQKKHPNTWMG